MSLSQHPSTRSALGHLGRLKSKYRGSPADLHHIVGVERAIAAMVAASANPAASAAPTLRDPAHFEANGRYLSDDGRLALDALFDAGASILSAAQQIGVSRSAAAKHRADWLARRASTPARGTLGK